MAPVQGPYSSVAGVVVCSSVLASVAGCSMAAGNSLAAGSSSAVGSSSVVGAAGMEETFACYRFGSSVAQACMVDLADASRNCAFLLLSLPLDSS